MAKLTNARRLWLELLVHGPQRRARGRTGYDCMHAGWTEWNHTVDGEPISVEEAKERFGDLWFEAIDHNWTERITEAGRAALASIPQSSAPDRGEG